MLFFCLSALFLGLYIVSGFLFSEDGRGEGGDRVCWMLGQASSFPLSVLGFGIPRPRLHGVAPQKAADVVRSSVATQPIDFRLRDDEAVSTATAGLARGLAPAHGAALDVASRI